MDPTRRIILSATAATFIGVPRHAAAKGPPVWNDLDQKALDDAYDQNVYAPNARLLSERRSAANKVALKAIGKPERIAYGPTADETLDIYRAAVPGAPIVVFIHGGAWKASDASKNAFLAEPFVKAGVTMIMPNFAGVEEVRGDLLVVADQVRRAALHVIRSAQALGGDPQKLFLMGHSSGGHLGGVLVTTDWARLGVPSAPFKGALLGSGMYDLKPVRLSKRSKYVAFTDEAEEELSPQRHIDRLQTPLILTYGLKETPEFQRQSRDFYAAVKAAGKPVELLAGEALNHYETQETLGNPYGFMGRPAMDLVRRP